jgi:hypothetical protein
VVLLNDQQELLDHPVHHGTLARCLCRGGRTSIGSRLVRGT